MSARSALRATLQGIVRWRAPVHFGEQLSTSPISRAFGLDRGTPIDRYYIDKFIRENSQTITGRALEVGELRYLTTYGAPATEKSVLAPLTGVAKHADEVSRIVIGDLADVSSLPECAFDCFVCTQTLHLIYDVAAAIRGSHHLLAKGGTFLGTVAGISQISRYDMDRWGDYWRFTTRSMDRALKEVFGANSHVQSFGNVLAAQAFLTGLAVEDLPSAALLDTCDEDYQMIIAFRATK